MHSLRRTAAAIVVAGTLSAVLGAPANAAAPRPAHASKVTGGSTTITLKKSARKALRASHLRVVAVKPASYDGKTLTTPVKGGSFSELPPSAKITTSGGFTVSHHHKSVSITDVKSTSNGSSGSGTAKVSGHGRIMVVKTGMPKSFGGSADSPSFSKFPISLAKPLIKVLDKRFDTKLFKQHAKFGTGSATLHLQN